MLTDHKIHTHLIPGSSLYINKRVFVALDQLNVDAMLVPVVTTGFILDIFQ